VNNNSNQSKYPEDSRELSPEDEPAVEEFCCLVATILVRVLASKGQGAYNYIKSNDKEANKQ